MADQRIKLSTIRQKFPMYKDVPDDQLLIAVRQKFYPSVPSGDFYKRVDYDTPKARMDPTEGMSGTDKFMAGAGKSVDDTITGVQQITGNADQAEVDEKARLDKALTDTGAGMAGNIAGEVAQLAIPVGGAASVVAKAAPKVVTAAAKVAPKAAAYASQAAQAGALAALKPVETGETRAGNALGGAVAGAAGQAVAHGATAVARGAANKIAPNIRALYEKAVEMGIPVRVDQLGDSRFLKTLASQLEKMPLTGGRGAQEAQQEAFNRAVSRQFGEDSTKVTPEVYAAAKRRLGGQFETLSARNNLNVTDDLTTRLSGVVDEAERFADPATANAVRNAVNGVLDKMVDGAIVPGRAYQSMDSMLGKLLKGGGEKAHYLGTVRTTLREGMDDSISAVDKEAWDAARGQYKAMKTVRDLIAKDGGGDISPALLAGRVNATNAGKEAMASGRAGEMGDIAMIGRQFVRDPVPNSGTAERLFASSVLPVAGAAGGAHYGEGNPLEDAAKGAAFAMFAGRGVNKVLNSPAAARYMANGVSPPAQALLRGGGKAAAIGIPASADLLFAQ